MKEKLIAILRLFGYFTAFLTVTIILMGVTKMLMFDWEVGGPRLEMFGESLLTVLGIAVTGLLIFGVSRSREVFRGWPGWRDGVAGFGRGALTGLGMSTFMLILTLAMGGGSVTFESEQLRLYLPYVLSLGVCLLVAALAEEWLFRGYPLTALSNGFGRGWANLLMALLFAAAHWGAAGFNAMTQINIVLGSLVVGALRFTRGGIATAWGFHFFWNFTQVSIGANLSLDEIEVPAVTFVGSGPAVLSGGDFGPEAGLGATLATILVLVIISLDFRRRGGHGRHRERGLTSQLC